MSDTFFTQNPHWQWWIVFYFFLGGIAGGAFALSSLLHLLGDEEDCRAARIGYYIAFPLISICGLLLIVDLNRPERFWHMLVQTKTWEPMFKWWSPISFGSWFVGIFATFSFLAFVGALAEEGVLRVPLLRKLYQGLPGDIVAAVGGFFGACVAGYTGVLLSVTNRPIWADSPFVGLLFLVSGVSTGAALMILFSRGRAAERSVRWLERMDNWLLLLELVVLAALVLSLWSLLDDTWANGWGVLLALGVLGAGILLPLALYWRPKLLGALTVPSAAALVLTGGFLLRMVIVMSSEAL